MHSHMREEPPPLSETNATQFTSELSNRYNKEKKWINVNVMIAQCFEVTFFWWDRWFSFSLWKWCTMSLFYMIITLNVPPETFVTYMTFDCWVLSMDSHVSLQ